MILYRDRRSARPWAALLPFSLTDPHVETDHAVLVADGYDRNIASDVVFHLDDLLCRLRNVGAVCDGKIIRHLLFNRDLWAPRGVGFCAQALRIDFDTAHAE